MTAAESLIACVCSFPQVAIHRDKFPETVPFRLTRMLVKAMGVSGVEGNFRASCEATMDVLHTHKDSVGARAHAPQIMPSFVCL